MYAVLQLVVQRWEAAVYQRSDTVQVRQSFVTPKTSMASAITAYSSILKQIQLVRT